MDAGKAVFFTNIEQTEFSKDAPFMFNVRKGAEEDKKNFESVIWNTFGFKPLTGQKDDSSVTNLTLDQWRNPDPNHKELKNCQCWVCRFKCPDLKNSKYVLVAFSSHGNEEISAGKRQPSVILSDGNSLMLTDILKALNNKTLKDIPKIVMLLSCRVFLKDPEPFQTTLPPDSVISLKTEKLQTENLSDTFVELKWETKANANVEYEIKQTTKHSNQVPEWKNATYTSEDSMVDQTSYTVFKITDLEPNTTYCFLLGAKVGQDFEALSEKEFVRTLDSEDAGVDIYVSAESTPDQSCGERMPDQPCGESMPDQPHGESMPDQPRGESMPDQPHGESMPDQPRGESMPDQPRGESMPDQPRGESMPDQPRGESMPDQPRGESMPDQPRGESMPDQPRGESMPDQPPEGNDDGDIDILRKLFLKKKKFEVKKVPDDEKLDPPPPVTYEDVYSAEKIPNDFLIVYGTTRGQYAKRHETSGSWVMEEMTTVVTQEEDDKELNMFHLLTKVAQRMANRKTVHETEEHLRNKKSILCFSHTLTENIILKKKMAAPPAL